MNAGALRLVVTIQRKAISRDAYGAETLTWSTLATVRGMWVDDKRVGDLERYAASVAKEVQRTARVIVLRFDPSLAVTELDRLVVESTTYDIERISDATGKRREWRLNVREVSG